MTRDISGADIRRVAELIGEPFILLGGAALPFYGVSRGTEDVDVEIFRAASFEDVSALADKIKGAGIDGDISANASGWGMIPLPTGYRERAIETDLPNLRVLDPVDFVLSKLRRGIHDDMQDSLMVSEAQGITIPDIRERAGLIQLPADPITGQFLKRLDYFFDQLRNGEGRLTGDASQADTPA